MLVAVALVSRGGIEEIGEMEKKAHGLIGETAGMPFLISFSSCFRLLLKSASLSSFLFPSKSSHTLRPVLQKSGWFWGAFLSS